MDRIETEFVFRVHHQWGTSTAIERGFRRSLFRIGLNAGGFSALCRRRLASVRVFCECGNVVAELSGDRGETISPTWLNAQESLTIPPGIWFRLLAPERPAAALLIVSGIVLGVDLETCEAGGTLPLGGTRRTLPAAAA